MRRFAQYGGGRINFIVTPDLVLDMRNAAKTLVTQIHIGREFTEDPVAGPRVSVRRCRNGTARRSASGTARRSSAGRRTCRAGSTTAAPNTAATCRRSRSTRRGRTRAARSSASSTKPCSTTWTRSSNPCGSCRAGTGSALNENDPFTVMECVPQIFPINGVATPVSPGTRFEYTYPDIFGRPWAQIWEKYHEEGMKRPAGRGHLLVPGRRVARRPSRLRALRRRCACSVCGRDRASSRRVRRAVERHDLLVGAPNPRALAFDRRGQ